MKGLKIPSNSQQENATTLESKKITFKDLCPEDKQKIGELLKRLAQEKEDKEILRKKFEEEAVKFNSDKDSISAGLTSKLDFSYCCEPADNFSINNCKKIEDGNTDAQPEFSVLKQKFNNLLETLKKTAKNQDDYFNKIQSNTESISQINSSLLKEEKPLEFKPTPFINNVNEKSNYCELSPLQTSLININDELKGLDEKINSLNIV